MAFDTFKDLKKGDKVKYENVCDAVHGKVSGEGTIFGFAKFGHTDVVWIEGDDGKNYALPYEDVKKI